MYGQRANLIGLYSGGRGRRLEGWGLYTGDFLSGGKAHFNFQSMKFTFLSFFFSIKHVFRHARSDICSKLTIKTPEYVKLTIMLKKKTS